MTNSLPPIVIPAYEPGQQMIPLIDDLSDQGFSKIIVVDDGSSKESQDVFDKLDHDNVTLIRHSDNMGKGMALKTAFSYILENDQEANGCLTVDADGQHLSTDALRVAETFTRNPNHLVLGKREFDGDVPARSKIGNLLTKYVFHLSYGQKISDTQTGLRAIPVELMSQLLKSPAKKYEFELEMLILAIKEKFPIDEVTINTVYQDNNESSHFRPIRDSLKIYFVMLRFALLSVLIYG
ncbi:MAG: glycosyltransferase family 2 protein, partial [Pseudomonadota bacterium]